MLDHAVGLDVPGKDAGFPGTAESNAIVFPSGDQLLSSLISPMIFLASGSWVWLRDAGDESSNAMSRQRRYLILVSDRL